MRNYLLLSFPAGMAALAAVALLGSFSNAKAADPSQRTLDLAGRALEAGLPQVAELKARGLLAQNLSPEQKEAAILKLAEALIDQNREEEALKELQQLQGPVQSALAGFLCGRAQMALGQWETALAQFLATESAASAGNPALGGGLQAAAIYGKAQCLQALGKGKEALRALESIKRPDAVIRFKVAELAILAGELEKAKKIIAAEFQREPKYKAWSRYLEARLLLAQGRAEQASVGFEETLQDLKGLPEGIAVGATLGLVEARVRTGGLETADNILEAFIYQHPQSAYLETLFSQLDKIYTRQENASDSELEKWAQKEPPRRAALSLYYLACMEMRENKNERSLKHFQQFAKSYPEHPLAARAWYCAGQIFSGENQLAEALACFESAMRLSKDTEFLAEVEMMTGVVEFKKREFVLASNRFRSAAGHSERLWEQAIFNSALCWLNQGNFDKFLLEYKEISTRYPESKFRPEMLLEKGLLQARSGDEKAREALSLFLRDFPGHPRAAEAQLALAELAFAGSDQAGSTQYLKAVLHANDPGQPGASPQTSEQARLLEIFQADSSQPVGANGQEATEGRGSRGDRENPQTNRVIELCQQFLQQHPDSELKDQVRMKLGQVYFRLEDYPNAQTQLETLARENPASKLTEAALFLAGQASMRSMNTRGVDRAIEIFQQVAEAKGPLQLYARQQQAIAYGRLGKEKEAVILYDEILNANPPAELRFAVLGGKGECLLSSAGKEETALRQAISIFEQLANQPDVTASWRNHALYKKAKCLEALSLPEEALAVYFDILNDSAGPASEGPDYTWYSKAGFDAAGALEAKSQWKAAIGIYEKLANLLGPRSEEAKKRVDQLRLEHFIWEE